MNETNNVVMTRLRKVLEATKNAHPERSPVEYWGFKGAMDHVTYTRRLLGGLVLKELTDDLDESKAVLTELADLYEIYHYHEPDYLFESEHEQHMFTALRHEKRNNFQSNFGGTIENVVINFRDECIRNDATWGKLFNYAGEMVATYDRGQGLQTI